MTNEIRESIANLNVLCEELKTFTYLSSHNHLHFADPYADPIHLAFLLKQQHLQALYDRFKWDVNPQNEENHEDWNFFVNEIYTNGNTPRIRGASGQQNAYIREGFHVEKDDNGRYVLDLHIQNANHIFTFVNSNLLVNFLNSRYVTN